MNIDDLLKEKGLTKATLAEKMGIRSQNVNVSLRNPTEETMKKLADALGVEMWELFVSKDKLVEQKEQNNIVCPKCGAKFGLVEKE